MSCYTGKRIYKDQETAEEALIEARIQFEHNKAINVYQCSDCSYWHLTSKGELNPTLKTYLESDTYRKDKLAREWNRKFRY